MAKTTSLTASDGHTFEAYETGDPRSGAALVLLQEIFGVNSHIRSVADQYSREGFWVIAPALFDRVQLRVELGYTPDDAILARQFASRLEPDWVLRDIAASIAHARKNAASGKVGVIGYCLGGSYAWLSATRLDPDAAVGYYGGKIVQYVNETPRVPILLHFGRQDAGIPLEDVSRIQHAHPGVPIHLYEAGHAFNRIGGANYSEPAAALAFSRSLAFLRGALRPQPRAAPV